MGKPKRWIIPDIHGCAETLKAAFDQIIRPRKKDGLYFLGDYIDRGPDSKGAMDFIMDLETQGYKVHRLMGNHEEVMLRAHEASRHHRKGFLTRKPAAVREWEEKGSAGAMQSFGIDEPKQLPAKYLEWTRQLGYYTVLDDYLLVHAGLNFELDDPFSDRHAMLWIRKFNVDPAKINFKTIIHGHAPQSLEQIKQNLTEINSGHIDLDNGIYMPHKVGFGNLCVLELNAWEL
ncbi:MAG: metallophosphoesterase [Bacteroidales bacterium]|nr:metallophosphoesterase [Bacteroidales bacterium]